MFKKLFALAFSMSIVFIGPATAQFSAMPPQAQQAFHQMYSIAQQLCQMGNPGACQEIPMLEKAYGQFEAAAAACQGGDMNACQMVQAEMPALAQAHQRYLMIAQQASAAMQGAGQGGMGQAMPHDQFQALMAQRHARTMGQIRSDGQALRNNMADFRSRIGLDP